jgi:tetratricopeptide (TPR) repeat protein
METNDQEGQLSRQPTNERKTLARAMVAKSDSASSVAICRLELTKDHPDTWQIQIQGDSPEITEIKRQIEALPPIRIDGPTDPETVSDVQLNRWSELLEVLRSKGYGVEILPESDHHLNFSLDLTSGRSLSFINALHGFAPPNEALARDISAAIAKALAKPAGDLAHQINEAVAQNDPTGAVTAIRSAKDNGSLQISLSPEVLRALSNVEVDGLKQEDRRTLLEIRAAIASLFKSWKIAGEDADALLSEFKPMMTPEETADFRLASATSAVHRGHKESGLLVFNELLNSEIVLPANKRAWCWRNISLALEPDDPDAGDAARQSADAFLQAGDKKEAARSLVRLSDCLAFAKPEDAIQALEEMFALAAKEGLEDRDLGSGAKHLRALRLAELGRHAEALDDARAAVELRRGIGGLETQLANSLHLASREARKVGLGEEADKWETEADALAESNPDPHHGLATEVITLTAQFDREKANELSKRAKAIGAVEIIAAVNVTISEHDPGLDEAARIAMLERTLDDLEAAEAHDRAKEPAQLALALRLFKAGQLGRAEGWFRAILDTNPLNSSVGQRLVECLWAQKKWGKAASFLREEVDRRGKKPGILFGLGKSLVEAGQFNDALSPLTDSMKLAEEPYLKELAREMRERALDAGATLPPPAADPSHLKAITYKELETVLADFSKFIAADKRMSFWDKEDGKHKWVSHPERRGKDFLHIYLKGKLGKRIEVFDELAAGAGRIDLYVRFGNGLAAVVELKMCGKGYSSTYAASGEEQICHYLENRDTSRGYLVVFDARTNDFGKPLLKSKVSGTFTLGEYFIDVRPTIKNEDSKGNSGD